MNRSDLSDLEKERSAHPSAAHPSMNPPGSGEQGLLDEARRPPLDLAIAAQVSLIEGLGMKVEELSTRLYRVLWPYHPDQEEEAHAMSSDRAQASPVVEEIMSNNDSLADIYDALTEMLLRLEV